MMKQYVLRYREGLVVSDGLIEASSFERAEEVGRAFCFQGNRRYISVRNPVLADESILVSTESQDQTEWAALTAAERLAAQQGKTVEEILEGLKKKRLVSPLQSVEAVAKTAAASKQ